MAVPDGFRRAGGAVCAVVACAVVLAMRAVPAAADAGSLTAPSPSQGPPGAPLSVTYTADYAPQPDRHPCQGAVADLYWDAAMGSPLRSAPLPGQLANGLCVASVTWTLIPPNGSSPGVHRLSAIAVVARSPDAATLGQTLYVIVSPAPSPTPRPTPPPPPTPARLVVPTPPSTPRATPTGTPSPADSPPPFPSATPVAAVSALGTCAAVAGTGCPTGSPTPGAGGIGPTSSSGGAGGRPFAVAAGVFIALLFAALTGLVLLSGRGPGRRTPPRAGGATPVAVGAVAVRSRRLPPSHARARRGMPGGPATGRLGTPGPPADPVPPPPPAYSFPAPAFSFPAPAEPPEPFEPSQPPPPPPPPGPDMPPWPPSSPITPPWPRG